MYNFIFILLLPFLLLKLLLFNSIKTKAYRERLLERLGYFALPKEYNDPNQTNIWIHAVSVGEIISCLPIISQIKKTVPNALITLTCTTPAGSEIIKKKLANQVFHIYFPFDISFSIKNFLKKIKPKLLILIEKELWPNTILHCGRNNIPIILANAQLSKKSFYGYLFIKPLISYCLKKINFICAQTKFDGYKLNKLISPSCSRDVAKNNIIIAGNTKFDAALENIQKFASANANKPNNFVWIAASTHPGEEEIILKAHKLVLQKIPNAILILAPRHIVRCKDLEKILKDLNLKFIVHSQYLNKTNPFDEKELKLKTTPQNQQEVYLLDTIGELNKLYSISMAAFVGGSLVPMIGGHNVLEPASFSIPIAVGPYTSNCKEIVFRMKSSDALVSITNAQDLSSTIINWLTNDSLRIKIGTNAKNYLYKQTGASELIVKLASSLL